MLGFKFLPRGRPVFGMRFVIGNLDNDEQLEVIVGGYSGSTSSNALFAINSDGSNVDNYPFVVGEKIKSGVALSDLDDNGIDDIIITPTYSVDVAKTLFDPVARLYILFVPVLLILSL